MPPQHSRILPIAEDLGLSHGPALEATIQYCNALSEDCPLNDNHLELVVQTYYAGYEEGIISRPLRKTVGIAG